MRERDSQAGSGRINLPVPEKGRQQRSRSGRQKLIDGALETQGEEVIPTSTQGESGSIEQDLGLCPLLPPSSSICQASVHQEDSLSPRGQATAADGDMQWGVGPSWTEVPDL